MKLYPALLLMLLIFFVGTLIIHAYSWSIKTLVIMMIIIACNLFARWPILRNRHPSWLGD